MSRIAIPTPENAPAASQPLLEGVRKALGVVPNLFRLIAQSPAALTGFAGLQGALAKTLDVKTRERIALAVAQANGCDYCLSAHAYLGAQPRQAQPGGNRAQPQGRVERREGQRSRRLRRQRRA